MSVVVIEFELHAFIKMKFSAVMNGNVADIIAELLEKLF